MTGAGGAAGETGETTSPLENGDIEVHPEDIGHKRGRQILEEIAVNKGPERRGRPQPGDTEEASTTGDVDVPV